MKKIGFLSIKSKLKGKSKYSKSENKIKVVIKQTEYKAAGNEEYKKNFIKAYEGLTSI